MSTVLPNDPLSKVNPAAGVNRDIPATEFPSLQRIQPTDLVGPEAANRQHAALEKRTESLRVALNRVIDIVNLLDVTYLHRDNRPAKDGVTGPTTPLPMNNQRLIAVGAPQEDTDAARLAEINYVLSLINSLAGTPTGMLGGFGAGVPTGWLNCNGDRYEPTRIVHTDGVIVPYPEGLSWAALGNLRAYFANAGNPWGGDGTTFMMLPDYRGRVILGAGTGVGLSPRAIGAIGGEEAHVLTIPEMPAHTHTQVGNPHGNSFRERDGGTGNFPDTLPTGSAGGNVAHNTMPPFAVASVGIKY